MSFDEDPRNDEPIDRDEWEKAMKAAPKPAVDVRFGGNLQLVPDVAGEAEPRPSHGLSRIDDDKHILCLCGSWFSSESSYNLHFGAAARARLRNELSAPSDTAPTDEVRNLIFDIAKDAIKLFITRNDVELDADAATEEDASEDI
jgi:hypothetical protein